MGDMHAGILVTLACHSFEVRNCINFEGVRTPERLPQHDKHCDEVTVFDSDSDGV